MNILAHLYLSGDIGDVMLGNYIGDFVKGNRYRDYPANVQKGIIMHRKIDHFTDRHEIHKQTRDIFREHYGLHAGIVTDIVYDHLLANHWQLFHTMPLEDFAEKVYSFLNHNFEQLPGGLQQFTPMMIKNNWLVMYRSIEGLERVLNGMARHTSMPDKARFAIATLLDNQKLLNDVFIIFMNELRNEPFFT